MVGVFLVVFGGWGGGGGVWLLLLWGVCLFVYEEIRWKTEKENVEMRLNVSTEEGENKDKASQEKETNRGMCITMLLVQGQLLL